MQRWILSLALALCLTVWLHPQEVCAQVGGDLIRQISIEGAERVEPATVRSYLLVREGDPFDPGAIDRSLKSLFSTGLFADVSFIRRGAALVITVVENPVINRIAFEGNKRQSSQDLEREVTLRPRVIFTRTKVQSDVKRILTIYRQTGRFAATVEPKIIQLPQNRVDLVFEINEGDPTGIENIRFVGNKEYADSKLREVVRTKESRWYRFLTSDDSYDPDRLALDRELLRRFYLKNGFADFRVGSAVAELTPDQKKFFITVTVDEGKRYKFGKVDISTEVRNLKPDDIQDTVLIESGDWYNADLLEKSVDSMTVAVGNLGFAFAEVRPRINRNRESQTIDVTLEVREGPKVYVERIDITGNVRTLDRVIRREFRLVEGDAFNTAKLRRSRQRIQNLDFFSKVTVEQVPGSAADKTIVKVAVEEKSTGSLSLGVGFSTTNGATFDTGIRERNLLGKGHDLRLNGTVSQRRTQLKLSFTEPYFLDRDVSAGFDVTRTETNLQRISSHDQKTLAFGLRAGYPITENLSERFGYQIKKTEITNVKSNASSFIRSQEGSHLLSEISHQLAYDRRDSSINPTDGYILRMINDIAGAGGDSRYLRNTLEGSQYFPLADDWVLALKLQGGYIFGIGKDVRLPERFFVGGDDLRGFANSGIGPRDKASRDALGGEWMYAGTVETTFPLPGVPNETGFRGRFFTDFGSSGKTTPSDSNLIDDTGAVRMSVGTGLTWISPFGAIGIDLGFPIMKEVFDRDEIVRVNFGTKF